MIAMSTLKPAPDSRGMSSAKVWLGTCVKRGQVQPLNR